MLTARIRARGNYYTPACEQDDVLPSLRSALTEVCRRRYRRLDRFIQLALIGSGRCTAGHTPGRECGIYLGVGNGPISSNIKVQQALFVEQELPMPFAFVNTLGSSSGFYIADNLGLDASAVVVSGRQNSLGAALTCAMLDLAIGAVEQALVGVVEVLALPLSAQRERLAVRPDRPLAEGSHWWLLEKGSPHDPGPRFHLHSQLDGSTLVSALDARRCADSPLCLGRSVDPASADMLRARFPQVQTTDTLAYHNSVEAAWLAGQTGECTLVTGSAEAGLGAVDVSYGAAPAPKHA